QALSTTVATAGVASLVGHHRRYHAPVSQLKALLADGQIGDIVTATMIWAMRKPDPYFEGNWRTAGGSPVMINLVHDIDLLRYVIGEIAEAIALPGRPLRNAGRIESGAVALAFENGAAATISFADTAPSPWGFEAGTGENPNIGTTAQDMLWITGTKGAVSFPSMAYWRGTDWGQPATRHPLNVKANTYTPLRAQLTHFLEVMDGAPPRIDIADAARTLEIATQIESQLSNALRDPAQVELEHAS
ncbi:MAG: Gfo/Idh/MocA family oxidoreductase, partial [Rhodobacteraceae bacterium]|nr:Gfo/Idh/MocA family oxidoreductase [Paracoccaceae bacterium]